MEIVKSLTGKADAEIKSAAMKIFVDWDKMQAAIEKAIILRPDEQVDGFVINEQGIGVSFSRKKGRKVSGEE